MKKTWRSTFVLLATILVAGATAKAETPVNFADPNLKAAVETQLGVPNPTPEDMLKLTSLEGGNRGIADLTGLEYATNLGYLNLDDNRISDLTPLAGLTSLTYLRLMSNRVADITLLAGLANLEGLLLAKNKITDITPLAGLKKLGVLNIGGNQIPDFTVLVGLPNLHELHLTPNPITDISALGRMTNLTWLTIGGNQFTDLSVLANLKKLTMLSVHETKVPDFTFLVGLTDLWWLSLSGNEAADIRGVSGLYNLTWLHVQESPVSDIKPVAGLTKLTRLYLYRNRIRDLSPLAGLSNLTFLELSNNEITDLRPLAGLTNLTELYLFDNLLTDIRPLGGLTRLKGLYLDNYAYYQPPWNQIVDISVLANLVNLEGLQLQGNQVVDIAALAGLTKLGWLNLTRNPLNAKACAIYIPMIKLNNPGINLSYDACLERVYTLTISSTPGGSVTNPGEGAFICNVGESVPIQAVAKTEYHFTRWSGTAVDAGKVAKPDSASTSVVVSGDYTLVANFAINAVVEDFEKGKLGAGWSSSEYPQWYVTSQDQHSGKYSARAGAIGDDESTSLTLRATVTEGRISFWRKVSSEPKFDVYRFSIDGKLQEVVSGEQEWQEVSFPVSAGSHTFVWEYTKDSGSSRGADTVYIDDVSIPAAP